MQVQNQTQTRRPVTGWLLAGLLIVSIAGVLALSACGVIGLSGIPVLLPGQSAVAGPTMVATVIVPSLTPTMTVTPAPSPSAIPTMTLTPTVEITPTPTETQPAVRPFQVQIGAPWYIPSFAHTSQGCRWVGLAGQVFDGAGQGVENVLVVASGTLEGKDGEWMGLSGSESRYGPGGYEISLSDHLFESSQVLSVQLFDLQGQGLTDPFLFVLPETCDQNLALVNFQAVEEN